MQEYKREKLHVNPFRELKSQNSMQALDTISFFIIQIV